MLVATNPRVGTSILPSAGKWGLAIRGSHALKNIKIAFWTESGEDIGGKVESRTYSLALRTFSMEEIKLADAIRASFPPKERLS